MIAIPSRDISIVSSNVQEGNGTIVEWSAGSYSLNDIVKITTATVDAIPDVYIGVIYKSLENSNNTEPLAGDSRWEKIDVLEYDIARTYKNGDTVSVLSTHNIYLSMEDDNNTSPLNRDSKWQFISKTNRYDFLDFYFTTVLEQINSDLVMELTFATSDHLSMFGIFGSTLTIEELDFANGDTLLKTHNFTRVDTTTITDFASYLQFEGCGDMSEVHIDLLPAVTQKIRVTITKLGYAGRDLVELATLSVGKKVNLGCTVYGIKSTRTALTPPIYDKWGDINLLGDDYVKVYTGKLKFDTANIDKVDDTIDVLFNQPVVYLLTDNAHRSFNTFGLMTLGELSLDNAIDSGLPLKIKSFKYRRNIKEC